MAKQKFVVRLKPVHDATGLTPYAVGKELNLSQTTVRKYVDSDEVVTDRLENAVLVLCGFYGVDWRDPAIVETREETSPETERSLTAA